MNSRSRVVVVATLAFVLAGCASSATPAADGGAAARGTAPGTAAATGGGAGQPSPSRSPSGFVIDRAALAACQTNKQTLQEALEEYHALTGTWPPASGGGTPLRPLQALVDQGLLTSLPPATNAYALTYDARTHKIGSNLQGC